ncbi:MAG TPA: hypothetical protein VIY47_12895 [Ignavibacteriaceae bacterium]
MDLKEFNFSYESNFGYQFFMIFVFAFLSLPASLGIYVWMFDNQPVEFKGAYPILFIFGFFFLMASLFTFYQFILDIFMPKKLTLSIDKKQIMWEESRNGFFLKRQEFQKEKIQEIQMEIHYYLGNYNYFRFIFVPKNEQHITEVISGNPLKSTLVEADARRIHAIMQGYHWAR